MKKVIALILIALVLVSCAPKAAKLQYQPKEVTKLFEDKESFVLVMGSSTCSGCIVYKPRLTEVLNHKPEVKLVYIEMDLVNKADLVTFVEDVLKHEVSYTPTTYFVKEGVVTSFFVGDLSYADLLSKFTLEGFINE